MIPRTATADAIRVVPRRETRPGAATFLAAVAAVAAACHVLFAAALAGALQTMFTHRVVDVTRLPLDPVDRFRFVGTFLSDATRDESRPVLLFAGSSFTFGYPWNESIVFSKRFADARPDVAVINASILSADVASVNDWILCGAQRNGVRVDTAVIEIPVVNTLAQLASAHERGHAAAPLARCEEDGRSPRYFEYFALRRPAFGVLGALWPAQQPRQLEFAGGVVPEGYFQRMAAFRAVQPEYERRIALMLANAQRVARAVYAYPSPVFAAGLREIGQDEAALRAQLDSAVAACSTVAGVRCLNPTAFYDRRAFFHNFSHLNPRGHGEFAAWLAAGVTN